MKNTILTLQEQKANNDKIAMITAYDYFSARVADEAGMNVILVGDSLAMVMLGHEDTLSVSVDEMLVFTNAVSRAAKNAFILADMPFMSYQGDIKKALKNAAKFIKKGRANGVKIEGGKEIVPIVKAIKEAGIPVVAHIGLTPQLVNSLGGYKLQGKDEANAKRLIEEAKALEAAGAFMVLLECVPAGLAKIITENLSIPTIGIGAGKYCDGQVLVWHDVLGINTDFKPKFVKRFANLDLLSPLKDYVKEVKSGEFPSDEFSFNVHDEWLTRLYK